jgi:hypothetical protein
MFQMLTSLQKYRISFVHKLLDKIRDCRFYLINLECILFFVEISVIYFQFCDLAKIEMIHMKI